MSDNYAIINSSNIVTDVTIWDGNTENWTPPSGFTCVGMGTFPVGIGKEPILSSRETNHLCDKLFMTVFK